MNELRIAIVGLVILLVLSVTLNVLAISSDYSDFAEIEYLYEELDECRGTTYE